MLMAWSSKSTEIEEGLAYTLSLSVCHSLLSHSQQSWASVSSICIEKEVYSIDLRAGYMAPWHHMSEDSCNSMVNSCHVTDLIDGSLILDRIIGKNAQKNPQMVCMCQEPA